MHCRKICNVRVLATKQARPVSIIYTDYVLCYLFFLIFLLIIKKKKNLMYVTIIRRTDSTKQRVNVLLNLYLLYVIVQYVC